MNTFLKLKEATFAEMYHNCMKWNLHNYISSLKMTKTMQETTLLERKNGQYRFNLIPRAFSVFVF